MSYEYIPTDTKFCDTSSCDECEDLELLSTNKEHDDTKENLLESADETLLEIETGVPSTNKTILKPKHDSTKVDVKDYSNRVQSLEKDIKDSVYELEEFEKATRAEIKEVIEQSNSKDSKLQSTLEEHKETLLGAFDEIENIKAEIEEQVEDINSQIESLPQNSQVVETYTRLNVLEDAIDALSSELDDLSQAGNEELAEKVATLEQQIEEINLLLAEHAETNNLTYNEINSRVLKVEEQIEDIRSNLEGLAPYTAVSDIYDRLDRLNVQVVRITEEITDLSQEDNKELEERLSTVENQLKDIETQIQERPTTTTDSEINERLESLEEGLVELIEDITDLPTTDDINRLNRINQNFEGRLNFLSSQYDNLQTEIKNLSQGSQSSDLETRLDSVEQDLVGIRTILSELPNMVIADTWEDLDDLLQNHDAAFSTIRRDLNDHSSNLQSLERRISQLNSRVNDIGSSTGQSVDAITNEELESILV